MGTKSKVFSLLGAMALSFGLVAGAVAQDSDTADGSVELVQALCTVEVLAGDDFDFGEWTWNGVDAYEPDPDTAPREVGIFVTVPAPGELCTITVETAGLFHEDFDEGDTPDDTNHIPASSFLINADGSGNPSGDFSGGGHPIFATLNSVSAELLPGGYTGVFTFTITGDTPGEPEEPGEPE